MLIIRKNTLIIHGQLIEIGTTTPLITRLIIIHIEHGELSLQTEIINSERRPKTFGSSFL